MKKSAPEQRTITLYDKQHEAFKALCDNDKLTVVFGGGVGSGKSHLMAFYALYMCSTYVCRGLIGRKRLVDLVSSTLPTLLGLARKMGLENTFKHDRLRNVITFKNGSELILRALDLAGDTEGISLGSIELTFACLEEAGEIDEKVYTTLVQRLRYNLDENNITGKILLVLNPTKNWVYTRFYFPWEKGELPKNAFFIQAGPHDSPFLPESYRVNLTRDNLDEWEYQTRVLMNWHYSTGDLDLFYSQDIDDAFYRDEMHVDRYGRYLSVDVAGPGKDKTCIAYWEGWHLVELTKHTHLNTQETARMVLDIARSKNISTSNVVVDSIGIGQGVADAIPHCVHFKANEKALNGAGFENKKAQCFYRLAERFKDGKIKLSCHEHKENIMKQLLAHKRGMANDKLARVTSKGEVSAIIKGSPDEVDAIMMRAIYDLKPTPTPSLSFIN